jgi:hypothetical protein
MTCLYDPMFILKQYSTDLNETWYLRTKMKKMYVTSVSLIFFGLI